jgi:hypothetical protein
MTPKIGELWRSTGRIPLAGGVRIPADTLLLIVDRRPSSSGAYESNVIWDGGTGWINDNCWYWEFINEAEGR